MWFFGLKGVMAISYPPPIANAAGAKAESGQAQSRALNTQAYSQRLRDPYNFYRALAGDVAQLGNDDHVQRWLAFSSRY